MEPDVSLEDLKRDSRKQAVRMFAIIGVVLIALGVGLLALGLTYEEPADRLATRSVPDVAVIGLVIAGGVVGLLGLAMIGKAVRAAASNDS